MPLDALADKIGAISKQNKASGVDYPMEWVGIADRVKACYIETDEILENQPWQTKILVRTRGVFPILQTSSEVTLSLMTFKSMP